MLRARVEAWKESFVEVVELVRAEEDGLVECCGSSGGPEYIVKVEPDRIC